MKENRTIAYRRHKASTKLNRKIKLTYDIDLIHEEMSYSDYSKSVLSGKLHTWMRSMNTACSCYMCSGYYKYKRIKFDFDSEM
ncbi:gp226 [Sphingomonas phage PAU]|uniref:gp226 n=1 Tax=Sphingomonas phage PAU TaxID=1150991 RepID=UPI0002573380|nr:gp226 [Sphingomonas phage PAU]AFF28224.1 gp226 [Sphingomonas phage PAU]